MKRKAVFGVQYQYNVAWNSVEVSAGNLMVFCFFSSALRQRKGSSIQEEKLKGKSQRGSRYPYAGDQGKGTCQQQFEGSRMAADGGLSAQYI
ncbi:hypothetical protein AAC387_Pa05g0592 [Persea americana]